MKYAWDAYGVWHLWDGYGRGGNYFYVVWMEYGNQVYGTALVARCIQPFERDWSTRHRFIMIRLCMDAKCDPGELAVYLWSEME